MKKGQSRLVRSNVGWAAVSALLLLVIAGGSFLLSQRTDRFSSQAFAIGDVDRQTGQVYATLVEAESSQRGFVLLQDDKYIAPYEEARQRITAELHELEQRLNVTQEFKRLVDFPQFKSIVDQKFAELAQTVSLVKQGRRDDALTIISSDVGRSLMASARSMVSSLRNAANDARKQSIADAQSSTGLLNIVTTLGVIAILLISIVAILQLARYSREIEAARLSLATVNVELERRVNVRTQDLIRANDEIQRYAYIVSHDLRAPLVNIMGFTSELEQSSQDVKTAIDQTDIDRQSPQWAPAVTAVEHDIPEALGFIKSSMHRMDGLINEILKLSRLGRAPLHAEWIDMDALIRECLADIQHRLDTAGASPVIEGRLPNVIGDRSSLRQIFANLLDNAVKYLARDRAGVIRIRGEVARGVATFEVHDNGRGVAPADHDRIFDLFRRAGAQDRPGDGIGLAHVRTLVRRLTGEIVVNSDGRSGSTFRVSFPDDLRRTISTSES